MEEDFSASIGLEAVFETTEGFESFSEDLMEDFALLFWGDPFWVRRVLVTSEDLAMLEDLATDISGDFVADFGPEVFSTPAGLLIPEDLIVFSEVAPDIPEDFILA